MLYVAWKPKEREITAEEAIEIAKREVEPNWFGRIPLFSGVRQSHGVSLLAFEKNFFQEPVLFYFVDPVSFCGETMFLYSREFTKRYQAHGFKVYLIFKATYPFYYDRRFIEFLQRKFNVHFQVIIDADYALADSLNVLDYPACRFIMNNQVLVQTDTDEWRENLEKELQKLLRNKDPGLPLLPLFRPKFNLYEEKGRFEFGKKMARPSTFPNPGFNIPSKEYDSGKFTDSPQNIEFESGKIYFNGEFMQDEYRIITQDKTATISFLCPGDSFNVVAHSLKLALETTKLVIELNGRPIEHELKRDELQYDDEGSSVLRMSELQKVYTTAGPIPPHKRKVVIRFPTADKFPIGIYSIRFGSLCKIIESTLLL